MENTETLLQKVGLSPKESSIYIALVETGPSTVSSIAKATGIHRPGIYAAIPSLLKLGLISLSPKGKQKRYGAEPPTALRAVAAGVMESLEDAIDELEETYTHRGVKPVVKFFEGPDEIKKVLLDVVQTLKREETYYRITSARSFESLRKYRPRNYSQLRDQKQLERYVIASDYIKSHEKNQLNRSVKVVPEGSTLFDHDINQIIYANKVSFIDYKSLTAVTIENKGIADHQREIFKLLYRQL